jgi:class 3 adenylate cyclase
VKYVELPGENHIAFIDGDDILDEIREFLTGVREPAEPDRVLATVLFTDIVGSTERARELGDRRWRELLDRHHELVRRDLARFRGTEIDTAGDGFFATFDGPARAIRSAKAITESVRGLGLEIRAGLHTGEVELAGDAVRGIAVHTGARVAAQAGPSEVLVSQTVKDLVAGSGIELEDRGAHELKGVPGEWRLYAVTQS